MAGGQPRPYVPKTTVARGFIPRGSLPEFRTEDRKELVHLANRPRSLGGDQVAEQLPYDRQPLEADPLQCRLGVLRQGSGHAADALVGLPGEQPLLAVALLPQAMHRKGHQGQRTPLALHLGDHPVHQQLAREAIELTPRRFLQRAPEPLGGGRRQRGQVLEDRLDLLVLAGSGRDSRPA